jgi:ATP-binding cassette subfamily D (ALD) protein 4
VDQRIARDCDLLCAQLAEVIQKGALAPFLIGYYTKQVIDIGGTSALMIYGFFAIGALVSAFLVPWVAATVAEQDKLEGEFRYAHAQLRANSEAAAFQGGLRQEEKRLNTSLLGVIAVMRSLMNRHWVMETVTEFFSYLGSILNYVVVAVAIFSGKYDHVADSKLGGIISENAFVSIYLIFKLSSLISLSKVISDLSGHVIRVSAVLALKNEDSHKSADLLGSFSHEDPLADAIEFHHVTLHSPSGNILFKGTLIVSWHGAVNIKCSCFISRNYFLSQGREG